MNKTKTRIATTVALTLIALALSIPLLTAETSPNWQTAPTFQDTEAYNLTWTLAAGQPSPKIGDTVWAVPNVKNESDALVPLASASPSPSPAPSTTPFTPDNDAVAVAAIASIILVAAMFGTLLAYRSHLSKKAAGAAAVSLLAFSCCAFLPLGSADQTATTGYKLATPTGSWDFQIKNYTDNSFGVVRGSDWANLMTFVGYVGGNPSNGLITPPWAGYSENASATWENIFANITYGVIESKEVAVGYTTGLADWMTALPADVEVVCYYQGNTYQFTNPSNTAGSPYTVKVGEKMLAGNYTAEDAKGRITWTSTNAPTVINSVSQTDHTDILLEEGTFTNTTNDFTVYLANFTQLRGTGQNLTILDGIEIRPLSTQIQAVTIADMAIYNGYNQIKFDFSAQMSGFLYPEQLTLRHLHLYSAGYDALYLKNLNVLMEYVTVNSQTNYAAYLYNAYDSKSIACNFVNGGAKGVYMDGCNQFHFTDTVFGGIDADTGQLTIISSAGVMIDNPWFYNSYGRAMYVDANSQILASNIHILDAAAGITNHTSRAIYIAGDNSIINGVYMEKWNLNKSPLICVEIGTGADNNIVSNVQPAKLFPSDIIAVTSVTDTNHGVCIYNGTTYVGSY